MISLGELRGEDYWQIKWQISALAGSILICAGLFFALQSLNESAGLQLRNARAAYNRAQTELDEIEQEEATIIANIDSYGSIRDRGITLPEDRLGMLENFARIRSDHSLFPVDVSIEEQESLILQYAAASDETTGPVLLKQSVIQFSMPLLHENDLLRLLDALTELPDFLVFENCSLNRSGAADRQYIYLGQHFRSACRLSWFTIVPSGVTQ